MKKILGILGTIGLISTPIISVTTVTSCGKDTNIRDIGYIDWSKILYMDIYQLDLLHLRLDLEYKKLFPKGFEHASESEYPDYITVLANEYIVSRNVVESNIQWREENYSIEKIRKLTIDMINYRLKEIEYKLQQLFNYESVWRQIYVYLDKAIDAVDNSNDDEYFN